MRLKPIFLCTGLATVLATASSLAQTGTPRSSFQKLAEYLSKGSGKWLAPNPNHDPDDEQSPRAFALLFDWVLDQSLLEFKVEIYIGKETILGTQGIWAWHPGKEQIVYATVSRNGTFTEGTTYFLDEKTFVTEMDVFRPDGMKDGHKDENVILNENEHKILVYSKDEQGEWVLKRTNIFRRAPSDP